MELIEQVTDLQYILNDMEKSIDKIYKELKNKCALLSGGVYFCEDEFIKNTMEETFDEINFIGDVQDLPIVYYNNKNGIEKACYLLYFNKEGFQVVDNENYVLLNLSIDDFNGVSQKLNVLETITNNLIWK